MIPAVATLADVTSVAAATMATRSGALWSIPYPQELNDLPMMIARHLDGRAFADMIIDQFDEMREQARSGRHPQALVMGIALAVIAPVIVLIGSW